MKTKRGRDKYWFVDLELRPDPYGCGPGTVLIVRAKNATQAKAKARRYTSLHTIGYGGYDAYGVNEAPSGIVIE